MKTATIAGLKSMLSDARRDPKAFFKITSLDDVRVMSHPDRFVSNSDDQDEALEIF